ncbi:hypothetical protein HZ994_18030 [Akkermansiaceae bacterium]|nr:hypothetical protein HZ994_18030 [Akkermansiaceae bacterium]
MHAGIIKAGFFLSLAATLVLRADTWTSSDGKTIEADFVRLQDDSLFLRSAGKEYSVPLSRLDQKSQGYARFLHGKMKELAANALESPIVAETALLDAIGADPKLVEGRNFLMEGYVKSISKSSSLGASPLTTAVVVLGGGTRMEMNLSGEADGRMTKVKVEEGRVVLTKGKNYSDGKYRDFEEYKTLMENGKAVVFRARVEGGKIIGSGIATFEEIVRSKVVRAPQSKELTAEEKAEIARIQIRVEYLESQLAEGAGKPAGGDGGGFLGPGAAGYTDGEKDTMRRELGQLKEKLGYLTRSAQPGRNFPR